MAGCHTLLICAYPCLSVEGTSLPECSVCSACSVGHSLPVCLFMSVVVFSHGIHGIHGMLGCVIGGVGMAGCHTLLICAHLCLSVGGFLCQNVLCVPRVLWEHSLCLLCWCCRGSCTSVVVFSHRFHEFPQMVRLRYWRRGYGRMPYPPNLCASVPICGRLSLPECSVCSACSVGTLSLFALLVLQRQLHQRGSILPRISTDG